MDITHDNNLAERPDSKKARRMNDVLSSRSDLRDISSIDPVAIKRNPEWSETDCREYVRRLFYSSEQYVPESLSVQFITERIGNDHDKFQSLLIEHGFRSCKITSPRQAISIYKDSCHFRDVEENAKGKEFLLVAFGLHPYQQTLESIYKTSFRDVYCLSVLCKRMRQIYLPSNERITENEVNLQLALHNFFHDTEQSCFLSRGSTNFNPPQFSIDNSIDERVNILIDFVVDQQRPRSYRKEEWFLEYERICALNSTLSNVHISLFQDLHQMNIKDVYYKFSQRAKKYERLSVYLYDPTLDECKPPPFLFLPSLHTVITTGHNALATQMVATFFHSLLRHGYYTTNSLQQVLEPHLHQFFLSALIPQHQLKEISNYPFKLNARFEPTSALSLYFYGLPGSGKSSLVQKFPTALKNTILEHVDPDTTLRFVKQNLNKPLETLELEFELRPNNNDLSLMSIIQGRRLRMNQTKPGIVVLNLEEMSSDNFNEDPNQFDVANLISQRFVGRKGYKRQREELHVGVVNNSDKLGVAGDCSFVTLFTSNYSLSTRSLAAFQRLYIFQHLTRIELTSISGSDRTQFAKSFLLQRLDDFLGRHAGVLRKRRKLVLDINVGEGDTRSLVTKLKIYAFHLSKAILPKCVSDNCTVVCSMVVRETTKNQCVISVDMSDGKKAQSFSQTLQKEGWKSLWCPVVPIQLDSRIQMAINEMQLFGEEKSKNIAFILEYWLSRTLTPTVVHSNDRVLIQRFMNGVSEMDEVCNIRNVDASRVKMMKSLYDGKDTPNLLEQINEFGPGALVAVELLCPSKDSQLCIREMIEDSPSMTAFSTDKSALDKSGLLFAIWTEGDVTPEISSRISLRL